MSKEESNEECWFCEFETFGSYLELERQGARYIGQVPGQIIFAGRREVMERLAQMYDLQRCKPKSLFQREENLKKDK